MNVQVFVVLELLPDLTLPEESLMYFLPDWMSVKVRSVLYDHCWLGPAVHFCIEICDVE